MSTLATDLASASLTVAELTRALAVAKLGVPARPQLPVFAAVSVTVTRTGLTLTTFDYTVSTRVHVAADTVTAGSTTVAVNLAQLTDVVKAAGKGDVRLTLTEDTVTVSAGLLTVPVAGVDRAELPALPSTSGEGARVLFDTTTAGLATIVGNVAGSASTDENLPAMCGVGISQFADHVTLSATDRYRLTEQTVAVTCADPGETFVVPARQFLAASKALVKLAGKVASVTVRTVGNLTVLQTTGATVTILNTDAEFPRVSALFPDEVNGALTVDARAMRDAVASMGKLCERNMPVSVTFDADRSYLVVSPSHAAGQLQVNAHHVAGDEFTTAAYSPRFLGEAFGLHTGPVSLSWTRPGRPVVVSCGDVRTLVMPVRLA